MTRRSNEIKDKAEAYQTQLIARYAQMETRIEKANILKKQIEALTKGNSDD